MRMMLVIAVLAACGESTARVEPDAAVRDAAGPDANTFAAPVGEPCIPDDDYPFCARGAGRCVADFVGATCRRLCVNHACEAGEYAADLGYCVCLPLSKASG